MTFALDVDGIEGWVPLDVDLVHDELIADLRDRIPDHDPDTFEILASLAQRNVQRNADTGGPPLLALWARIPDAQQVVPDAIATLSLVPVTPDATPASVTGTLIGDLPLFRPVSYADLDTTSGPATAFEALTESASDEGSSFLATYGVLWLRAHDEQALVLTASTIDLVGGAAWREELLQLATGVRGYA